MNVLSAASTSVAVIPTAIQRPKSLNGRWRRVDARSHLEAALDTFERLGAAPWAERARQELRASGQATRRRDPSTLWQLTPQELQVARFVAQTAAARMRARSTRDNGDPPATVAHVASAVS